MLVTAKSEKTESRSGKQRQDPGRAAHPRPRPGRAALPRPRPSRIPDPVRGQPPGDVTRRLVSDRQQENRGRLFAQLSLADC